MDRWTGKVAVVTGAGSGIGAAIALALCRAGVRTVGLDRNEDTVQELRQRLATAAEQELLFSRHCDVTNEQDIVDSFAWVEQQFGGVDILVNNAGILKTTALTDAGNTELLRETLAVNVLGVVLCTREAFRSMKRGAGVGHVVLMNSVAGHNVPYLANSFGSLNLYQPTKHAITAMTEVLRQEFQIKKSQIKVTSISPGMVDTQIFGNKPGTPVSYTRLNPEDVADAVIYVLGTPQHVQVHELTLKPLGEEFL